MAPYILPGYGRDVMFNAGKTLKGLRKSLETGSQVKIMEAVRTLFFHALIE